MTKKNCFLITTPEHDDTVAYCSAWSREVIEFAKSKGFQVIEMNRDYATKKEFEKRIAKHEPGFVMFNGHGNKESVWGNNNEVLVKSGENEGLLKERITYALTCSSLQILGETATKNGALAYIGYRFPFVFYFNRNFCSTPLRDNAAKSFFEPSNRISTSIIKGASVSEAIKRSQEKMDQEISFWRGQETADAEWVRSALHMNRMSLGFKGNGSASLS